jgi:hypothetical protein
MRLRYNVKVPPPSYDLERVVQNADQFFDIYRWQPKYSQLFGFILMIGSCIFEVLLPYLLGMFMQAIINE